MTTFDKREQGFEAKFVHDEELMFKATAGPTSCSGSGPQPSSASAAMSQPATRRRW